MERFGRVLAVDDNRKIREAISVILNMEKYEIQTAENGEIARGQLEQNEFDVVISDVEMPVLNGLQLLEHIKTNYENTKVVLIGDTIDPDEVKQADFFMEKPINFSLLLEKLEVFIKG